MDKERERMTNTKTNTQFTGKDTALIVFMPGIVDSSGWVSSS